MCLSKNYSFIHKQLFDNLKAGIVKGIITLSKMRQPTSSALAFEKVDFRHLSRCEPFDGYTVLTGFLDSWQ